MPSKKGTNQFLFQALGSLVVAILHGYVQEASSTFSTESFLVLYDISLAVDNNPSVRMQALSAEHGAVQARQEDEASSNLRWLAGPSHRRTAE